MVAVTMADENSNPVALYYDPANGINKSADPNTSKVIRKPTYISISGMLDANLTTVTVQIRVHKDDIWHDFLDIDKTVPNALVVFSAKDSPNFCRVQRVGTDDFIVYAQTART